jgi:hypothetical protein
VESKRRHGPWRLQMLPHTPATHRAHRLHERFSQGTCQPEGARAAACHSVTGAAAVTHRRARRSCV